MRRPVVAMLMLALPASVVARVVAAASLARTHGLTSWLAEADYAVLSVPGSNFVPWAPGVSARFDAQCVLVGSAERTYSYLPIPTAGES